MATVTEDVHATSEALQTYTRLKVGGVVTKSLTIGKKKAKFTTGEQVSEEIAKVRKGLVKDGYDPMSEDELMIWYSEQLAARRANEPGSEVSSTILSYLSFSGYMA